MARITRRGLRAGCVALVLVVLVGVGRAEGPHDGEWLIELTTSSGNCRTSYSTEITIRDGVIAGRVQGQMGTYTLHGNASPDGRFEWKTLGPDPGTFQGSLSGDRVQGSWSTSRGCRGSLSVRRR
jgi:hypothetical protein